MPKIIVLEEKELTPEERELELTNAFGMNDVHAVLPPASNPGKLLESEDMDLLMYPGDKVSSVPLGRIWKERCRWPSDVTGAQDAIAPCRRGN